MAEDGSLEVGCILLETTLKNMEANGQIAVSVCNGATLEGYQIKGTAKYVTEGAVVEKYKAIAEATFKGAMPASCRQDRTSAKAQNSIFGFISRMKSPFFEKSVRKTDLVHM